MTGGSNIKELAYLKGKGAETLELDGTAPLDDLKKVADKAVAIYGRIDVLANNAGYILVGALEESTPEETLGQFNTNIFGALNVTRAFLPHMCPRRTGTFVWLGSIGGWRAVPNSGLYGTTKWALRGISETLHVEVSPLGLRSICIDFGYFCTSFLTGDHRKLYVTKIDDYQEITEKVESALQAYDGKQPGDPKKGVLVMLDVVREEGVAQGKEFPKSLLLGSDCFKAGSDTGISEASEGGGICVEEGNFDASSGSERAFGVSILSASCPISVNNLRVLDVNISHAEDLGLLREVLAMTEVLQILKVSHDFLKSKADLLPAADLNLANVESLTVKMSDYQELECPVVYPALFRWWCDVWANTRATSIDELIIRATLDSYAAVPAFDTTLWSHIARTLSGPPWETLSALKIVIYTSDERFADSIFSPYIKDIKDVMATLTGTHSVEVAVSLYVPLLHLWSPLVLTLRLREYPEPDYELEYDGDDPVEGGEGSDEENFNIGYPF
ncbi:hypothetical protein F5146DRAFT_1135449 [Armillaria mellea]|nr:hypothetical protein F5146DRAFT_1135449 [Armillaria mellea]